jgi:hypothetical protein
LARWRLSRTELVLVRGRAGGGGQSQLYYSRKFTGSQILHLEILKKESPK